MADAEKELFELFDDLEAQAGAMAHRERLVEVADRSRSAYHEVTLESRLMASVGVPVRLDIRGVGVLEGRLERVGTGWCRVAVGKVSWVVCVPALVRVRGASTRSVPEVAWSVVDRLGHASVLRRLADEERQVSFHLDDGSTVEGSVSRVGADFVEVTTPVGASELVVTARIAAHREG